MRATRKLKRHMRRLNEMRVERIRARKALEALGVTSLDGCHNKAVDPQESSSSSLGTSKLAKEEGHGEDLTVSSDEETNSNSEDEYLGTTPEKNDVGEEEEVAIPVKQLKTSAKARVIDKPNPKAKPKRVVPLLKPRPRFPCPSFCFVCVTPVYWPIDPSSKVTKADCTFLLKEMLELSKVESHHYLGCLKEPQTMIGFCVKCLEVIREAVKLRKKISELEMGLKRYQRQIVKTMKETELSSFTGVCNRPMEIGEMREKRVAIENLLRIVSKRKYSSVLSSRALPVKKKDPLSGLDDIQKEAVTVTSAPANDIKAGGGHPISHIVQKKIKTYPPRKNSLIMSTTPKTSGKHSSASTVILKQSSSEVPIPNFNDCKDLRKDPLALDDEIDDIFCPDLPDQKPEKIKCEPEIPNPPIPSVPSAPAQYLICGLCKDDKIYESGAQLQLHTDKVHGPNNQQPQPPQKVPSSLTKSSDKTTLLNGSSTSSSRLEEEKRESIINSRRIPIHPTRTKVPLKTYSRKQPPPNSGNKDGNTAKGSDIFSSEDSARNALHVVTKWGSYDCPICPTVKDYGLNRFIQHLAIHQRRPYRCTTCSELFPEDEDIREEHWKDKHSDASPTPSTSSPLESPVKFVKLKLTPGPIWKCGGCPSAFITEDGRDNHEIRCSMVQGSISMSNLRIKCSTCKKSSHNMEEWRLHRAIHHPEEHRTCCTYCDKSFVEKSVEGVEFRRDQKMVEHIQKDHLGLPVGSSRAFEECELCGVVFKLISESEAHFFDVHGIPTGERKFTCPICHVKIGSKHVLTRHINGHFPREPSVCDICGISIRQPKQTDQELKMVEHKLQKHGILPEWRKLHSCPENDCQFKTVIKWKMDRHTQRDHGGARMYTCKHCGKGFMCSSQLRQHELIHENKVKKPYQCEICGNSFALQNYLYIHKRLSHEGRTFPSTNQKRGARPGNQLTKKTKLAAVQTTEGGSTNEVVTPST